jgi:hypothetical protein
MKVVNSKAVVATLFLTSLLFATSAQANFIEQILSNPRIQALLGKPAEILSQSQQCKNVSFKNANTQLCADVANAEIASKMPFEMRTVMTNRTSSQALRDLCLAAQTTGQQNNYLCAELSKADKDFAAAAAAARTGIGSGNSTTNDLSN